MREQAGDCAAHLPLSVGELWWSTGAGSLLSILSEWGAGFCVSMSVCRDRGGDAAPVPSWLHCMAVCVKKSVSRRVLCWPQFFQGSLRKAEGCWLSWGWVKLVDQAAIFSVASHAPPHHFIFKLFLPLDDLFYMTKDSWPVIIYGQGKSKSLAVKVGVPLTITDRVSRKLSYKAVGEKPTIIYDFGY